MPEPNQILLNNEMAKKNMTNSQLAKELGVTSQTIRNWRKWGKPSGPKSYEHRTKIEELFPSVAANNWN